MTQRSRASFFAHKARQRGDVETNNTTARPQQGTSETGIASAHPQQGPLETGITSAPEKRAKNAHFAPAKAMAVSIPHEHERAKAMAVSDKRPSWPTGSGCGTRGRRQGLAGLRAEAQAHISTPGPTGVEGAGGICRGAGGRWRGLAGLRDDAPSEARSAGGSRAGHRPPAHTAAGASGARNTRGYTQQPGPAGHAQQPAPAAGPSGARNTSGATCHLGITKPPGPTGAGRLSQFRKLSAESRQCRGLRGRSPGGRWKYRAWKQRPSRFPPCGGPRRRRWRSAWPSRRRSRRRCLRSQPG